MTLEKPCCCLFFFFFLSYRLADPIFALLPLDALIGCPVDGLLNHFALIGFMQSSHVLPK